jgi:hypothetical protein
MVLPPSQSYGRLNDPNARVSYMNPPAHSNTQQDDGLEALENLIAYIAEANGTDLFVLLRQKGISPTGYDMASIQYATMEMLAAGNAKQQEQNFMELMKIHPDAEIILQAYGNHPAGCDCTDCKTPFFTKDRLLFIGLIIFLFAVMYFITQKD